MSVTETDKSVLSAIQSGCATLSGITPHLDPRYDTTKVEIHPSLESTNKRAKELAGEGCPNGAVVIAHSQWGGRGRKGRSFASEKGNGLYMSIVLENGVLSAGAASTTTMATVVAAVAARRAIGSVTGVFPDIKWVNDLLIDGKKVCGILSEGVSNIETGKISHIVLGIGINTCERGLPKELRGIAGSIPNNGTPGLSDRLAAELINVILYGGLWEDMGRTRAEYRSALTMLGQMVTLICQDGAVEAEALDIDRQGGLIVRLEDGTEKTISSGEVSLRLKPRA